MTTSLTRSLFETHPRFAGTTLEGLLVHDRPLWTATELRSLTTTVAADLATPLHELVHFDEQQRWWARLALTEGVELWLLSWLPGQHTQPHDHGGAAGSFTVLTGEIDEEYRYLGGPIRRRTHAAGKGIGFSAGRAHQVWGAQGVRSASVHAYSPPLVSTREYSHLDRVLAEIPPTSVAHA